MGKIDLVSEDDTIRKGLVHGLNVDADSRETREGLSIGLLKLNRTCASKVIATIAHTLNDMILIMPYPFQKYLGDGVVKDRNLI